MKYCCHLEFMAIGPDATAGSIHFQDFDLTTFSDFLDTLLDRDNFNFYKEVEGSH